MHFIAGIDEVGRGPLAGPVTAACVVLPKDYTNPQIKDSKKLSPKKREELYPVIIAQALAYSVVSVGHKRIDQLNIRNATKLAMELASKRVFAQLKKKYGEVELLLLIDGNMPICTTCEQRTIIKGDQKELAIAAASIIAKVTRDRLMDTLEKKYPGYRLDVHKGYPTLYHREALKKNGASPIHRRTFAGVP